MPYIVFDNVFDDLKLVAYGLGQLMPESRYQSLPLPDSLLLPTSVMSISTLTLVSRPSLEETSSLLFAASSSSAAALPFSSSPFLATSPAFRICHPPLHPAHRFSRGPLATQSNSAATRNPTLVLPELVHPPTAKI